ncbi:hypothetical protein TWF696_003830 [Orbilia brochopaga]|uniref:Uncharacterized protein n=1 Tax=Orbilia brochopaga TaxID=3140254 RepID=A0AAV9VAT1_9PEZI
MNFILKFTSRLITLLVLCSLVADVTASNYYQKSVKTIQACSTQYCNQRVRHVPTQIRIVHKTAKVTVTVHPRPSTYRVTKKYWTTTVRRYITKTYTVTAKTRTRTVYTTRSTTITSTVRAVSTSIVTVPIDTITSGTTTIPQPSGFISVFDDPDNKYTRPDKRNSPNTRFPTAIKCTKTIQTIYKHTATARPQWKAVVKYGKTRTAWRVVHRTTRTIYPQERTTTVERVSSVFTTTTSYTSTTTTTTSVTVIIPSATAYQACGRGNTFSGATGSVSGFLPDWTNQVPARDETECCTVCHAHVNAAGQPDCQGSYFSIIREDNLARCWLVLRGNRMCSYSNTVAFEPQPNSFEFTGYVSNGQCGRWKSTGQP